MKKTAILICLIFMITGLQAQTSPSAVQVFDRAVAKISGAKGVEANFKVFNSGYSGSGSVKTLNGKFKVTMPDVEVWYNGKDLYTYNKNTSETTVVTPTPEELSQSNPLAYVTGAKSAYNISFSTVKKTGKYVLELIPKAKGSDVKRITLTLGKTDYIPEKIVVEPSSGNPVSADITGFKTGVGASPSEFEYPKSKYPKVEIIDLR